MIHWIKEKWRRFWLICEIQRMCDNVANYYQEPYKNKSYKDELIHISTSMWTIVSVKIESGNVVVFSRDFHGQQAFREGCWIDYLRKLNETALANRKADELRERRQRYEEWIEVDDCDLFKDKI